MQREEYIAFVARGGRPAIKRGDRAIAKYEYWRSEDGLTLLAAWARDGLSYETIAGKCGVAAGTLRHWRRKYPEIAGALGKGRELCDVEVENALLKNALAGNFSAQTFWLKNRRPDAWREKPQGGEISEEKRAAYRALFAGPKLAGGADGAAKEDGDAE